MFKMLLIVFGLVNGDASLHVDRYRDTSDCITAADAVQMQSPGWAACVDITDGGHRVVYLKLER